MTLEQLRIFIAVAERQHMTQGAQALNLTQSATSSAIATLEARHQIKLFHRVGRHIELTDAGRTFLPEARAILARVAEAEKVLCDLAELKYGALTLAASQTVANYWLPPLIHHYQSRYPGIHVSLKMGNTEQIAKLLEEGEVDLGFIEGSIESDALEATSIATDEMVLVVGATHPWAQNPPISLAGILAGPWVLRERGSGTRSMLEMALTQWGLDRSDLKIALELPSNEAVRAAVETGAGVSAMSSLVVASSLSAGTLVTIDMPLPKRSFFALKHKQRYTTKAVEMFLALASSMPGQVTPKQQRGDSS